MKKANVAQQAFFTQKPLKRSVDGIMVALKAFTGRLAIVRCARQHRITFVSDALMVIVGFEVAVAIQFISGVRILPLGVMLGGSLLSLLFLVCIKILLWTGRTSPLQEINGADLLERPVVALQTSEARPALSGRIILVTGAAGSIGSELCRQLLDYEPEFVIALDTNETGLFDLAESLHFHPHAAHLCPYIGDITDVQGMSHLFSKERPHIVFHAAAYKHVPLLEQYPDQAIRTNVLATFHLCRLAQEHQVARFVFISSDKAAEPTGVMGASKRIGEMIVQALADSANCMPYFCAVRFGNVIGSRGSVVPIFAQQIKQGGPITVTDPNATRYFMTVSEACGLVILSVAIADRGGLYLLDMGSPVRIMDLAINMIRLHGLRARQGISIVYTGLRPGEHLHETLVAANEELIPTAHSKIFRVTCRGRVPTLTTLVQSVQALQNSLESGAQLREHLFEIVQEQALIVSG